MASEPVYIPGLCGDEVFWDCQLTLNTSSPQLTECFRKSVVTWLPAFFVFLISLGYLPYVLSLPKEWTIKTGLNRTKMVLSGALMAISVLDLILAIVNITSDGQEPNYMWISPSINVVTYAYTIVLIHLEFQRTIYSSGPLLGFWFISCVSGVPTFIQQVSETEISDMYGFVMFFISYSLVVLQFLLAFIRDFQADAQDPDEEERQALLGRHEKLEQEEEQGDRKKRCPEETASFLSNAFFAWIAPMIVTGNKRALTFDDMPDIMDRDKCKSLHALFQSSWKWRAKKLRPLNSATADLSNISAMPMFFTLIQASRWPFIASGILRLAYAIGDFLNPLLLQCVIDVVASDDPNYLWKGLSLGFILMVFNVYQFTVAHNYFKYCTIMAMNGRSAVITAVYRKSLRLSSQSRRSTTAGEIVNLMSVDSQKIYDNFFDIHEAWACALVATLALLYLWTIVGPSALAAVALLAILAPLSGVWMTAKFARLQDLQMEHKDQRLKIINEILAGIKVLKMYGWEPSFQKSVDERRHQELLQLRKQAYLHGGIGVIWTCSTFLISLAVFTTYVLVSPDNYLSPQVAFVSMSVIHILNMATSFLPMFLAFAAQAYISAKRITRMLQQEELDKDAVTYDPGLDEALTITDGTFSWDNKATGRTILKDLNMSVSEGKLVAVVGPVGAGKSSIIQAILGEMHKLKGDVRIRGSLAYVPQQAWIQNNTLKNNILFSQPCDESKYQLVLDACALLPDLNMLPAGDRTEIGEKGVNLSGGQKQRVSLARAVYQEEDLYLLDDPLSAVDAHVGKHIFEKVVGPQGLLKNKTRILVTHGLTYLAHVDKVYVISDGRISEAGTYQKLMSHNGSFAELVRTFLQEAKEEGIVESEEESTYVALERQLSALSNHSDTHSLHESMPGLTSQSGHHGPIARRRKSRLLSRDVSRKKGVTEAEDKVTAQKLIEEESAELGSIKWSVLKDYILAGGLGRLTILIVFLLVYMAGLLATNLWLSAWSDDPYDPSPEGQAQTRLRLGIYSLFGAIQMLGVAFTALSLYLGCVVASGVLHSRLLRRILRAPMSFFDTTPLGRIVNRFSTDMDKIDVSIPMYTRWWIMNMAPVLTSIVIIIYSTPIFTAVIVPLLILYVIVQRLYITAVRQMKRIDSIRRSPIFSNFDETLVGVTSIRAYGQQERFILKNDHLTDNSQVTFYPINIAQRFLGILLNTMGAVIVFFTTVFAVLQKDMISAGLAGVSITYAMQCTWSISLTVRGATELETHVVSVERVKEYSELEQEAPWRVEGNTPEDKWPSQGIVEFDEYSTRYRPGLDLVLKGVSFKVNQGEKLGIVGRTGAGKSSMALSLFRIVEAAGGRILVDGLDIAKIGLHDLREKLTVIPQDPVLFSGTLRTNLDPFSAYTDDELWKALKLAHLSTFVLQLPDGLCYECGEGGEALSVGQRQLVCLARALLRHSQVLILDEATAAVDLETDELIQTTIRTAFKEATVLTIAHRLNTILDYDRVLVLAGGEIKEIGAPNTLLKDTESLFYGMAKDANIV